MSALRMPKRVISSMLAAVLAITLIPSDVLPKAYAAPADSSASAQSSTDDAANTANATAEATPEDDANAGSPSKASTAAAERPVSVTSSTEPLSGSTQESVERVQATVTLGANTTQTLFSFAGLNFAVNADGKTATLIGVANTSLEGDIAIPAQVASNNTTYAVTNISSTAELRGGGPRLSVISQG